MTSVKPHSMREIEQMLERRRKEITEVGPVIEEKQTVPVGVDPKGSAGEKKLPLHALPWAVVLEASCAIGEGMIKYGLHNWRTSGGVEAMTYISAAERHLIAFVLGEDTDPESGICHITKAIASLMVLRDAQLNGTAIDNRPPALPDGVLEAIQNQWGETRAKAEEIVENQVHG